MALLFFNNPPVRVKYQLGFDSIIVALQPPCWCGIFCGSHPLSLSKLQIIYRIRCAESLIVALDVGEAMALALQGVLTKSEALALDIESSSAANQFWSLSFYSMLVQQHQPASAFAFALPFGTAFAFALLFGKAFALGEAFEIAFSAMHRDSAQGTPCAQALAAACKTMARCACATYRLASLASLFPRTSLAKQRRGFSQHTPTCNTCKLAKLNFKQCSYRITWLRFGASIERKELQSSGCWVETLHEWKPRRCLLTTNCTKCAPVVIAHEQNVNTTISKPIVVRRQKPNPSIAQTEITVCFKVQISGGSKTERCYSARIVGKIKLQRAQGGKRNLGPNKQNIFAWECFITTTQKIEACKATCNKKHQSFNQGTLIRPVRGHAQGSHAARTWNGKLLCTGCRFPRAECTCGHVLCSPHSPSSSQQLLSAFWLDT